jgi:hypothetical protein
MFATKQRNAWSAWLSLVKSSALPMRKLPLQTEITIAVSCLLIDLSLFSLIEKSSSAPRLGCKVQEQYYDDSFSEEMVIHCYCY